MSIFGKKARLMNCAPTITNAELWKRAEARGKCPSPDRQAFALELVYDAHKEVVWLEPGQVSEPLEPSAARALAEQYRNQGVVLVEDERDLMEQRLEGLEALASWQNEMGDAQMLPFEVSLNEQHRRLMAGLLQPIRLNQEKEKVVREFMDELRLDHETAPRKGARAAFA